MERPLHTSQSPLQGDACLAPSPQHTCYHAHLIAVHNPHATAPTSIGSLEDNREAIGVGELVSLMQGVDGSISARDHWDTCWEGMRGLCSRLHLYYTLSEKHTLTLALVY